MELAKEAKDQRLIRWNSQKKQRTRTDGTCLLSKEPKTIAKTQLKLIADDKLERVYVHL
jgi:hypothetical protein